MVVKVHPYSSMLIDREGRHTVATTDPRDLCVYLSEELKGEFLVRVLIHELAHCVMFSYGLLDKIHDFVPMRRWIDAEEWVCNFIADYGIKIFKTAYKILGDDAIFYIPYELEKLVA